VKPAKERVYGHRLFMVSKVGKGLGGKRGTLAEVSEKMRGLDIRS